MINIEFKEAQPIAEFDDVYCPKILYCLDVCKDFLDGFGVLPSVKLSDQTNQFILRYNNIESITPYTPTQDPMLDRSHILSLLNRS